MLRIGDIHITSKIHKELLESLSTYISRYPEEKNIIFLGDYVYHFSYDRKALLALFGYFIELRKTGKNVYILAGNHDRISNHFVFSEGKFITDLLDKNTSDTGSLQFITKPSRHTIEGKDCYFFPFHIPDTEVDIYGQFKQLTESKNIQEQRSGYANSLLESQLKQRQQKNPGKECFVFHHWYFAQTAFPGQFAKFSYKSPALSPDFFNIKNVRFISGHLHKPFVYQNYLCCGSIWSTSPLEVDQLKFFFQYSVERDAIESFAVHTNPYMHIPYKGETLEKEDLVKHLLTVSQDSQKHLLGEQRDITHTSTELIPVDKISLTILTQQEKNISLEECVDSELLTAVASIHIKQRVRLMQELLANLQDASLELDKSIADRKSLLTRFIESKYGENSEEYLTLLKKLEIT